MARNPRICIGKWEPESQCPSSSIQAKEVPFYWASCPIGTSKWWHEAHLHQGEQSALLKLLMLISLKNSFTDTSRRLDQGSWHAVAPPSWHITLSSLSQVFNLMRSFCLWLCSLVIQDPNFSDNSAHQENVKSLKKRGEKETKDVIPFLLSLSFLFLLFWNKAGRMKLSLSLSLSLCLSVCLWLSLSLTVSALKFGPRSFHEPSGSL